MKWVNPEEIENLECCRTGWIARDKDGAIYLYAHKPYRKEYVFVDAFGISMGCIGFSDDFLSLQWEDEPRLCQIELKVLAVQEKQNKRSFKK